MKTVNFLGQDWEVPEWAEWITQDSDGGVFVWEHQPKPMKSRAGAYYAHTGKFECIDSVVPIMPIQRI